jgi:RecJ-like exonuclease
MNDDLKPDEERKPGDEAPPGEPSSGENACPECEGSGEKDGARCPNCEGTGRVNEAIGGG